jgi:predicted nicotinamide N-methyase
MTGSARAQPADPEIIRTATRLRPVPLVPEIRLHQAGDPISLWQRTELISGRTGLDPPFWAFAWAGGQALARYLLDHPETVRGRHPLDIASGSGLVAIAAAMAGSAAVTAYDIDPLAATAIQMNAKANGVRVMAVCADILDQDDLPAAGTDPILVADAFYDSDLARRVIRFAERAHARGATVLVGDFGRAFLPRDRLTPLASYDVPGLRVLEDSDIKHTTVWTLNQPRPELWPVRVSRGCQFCARRPDAAAAPGSVTSSPSTDITRYVTTSDLDIPDTVHDRGSFCTL